MSSRQQELTSWWCPCIQLCLNWRFIRLLLNFLGICVNKEIFSHHKNWFVFIVNLLLLLWFHCNIDPSVLIPPPQCHGKHSTNMKLFWTQAVIVPLWKRTHLIILSFSVLILPKSWKKLYWKSKCPALLPRLKSST